VKHGFLNSPPNLSYTIGKAVGLCKIISKLKLHNNGKHSTTATVSLVITNLLMAYLIMLPKLRLYNGECSPPEYK
jgi:hypothetical protein